MIDRTALWVVIIGLGLGSFFLRFVFTGLVGNKQMPAWLAPDSVATLSLTPIREASRDEASARSTSQASSR